MSKVIIIGGGVAGLAAGIYAQKANLESTIYERHTIPGGLLSYWDRKGYHLDNCVHWLTGTNPEKDIYKVWEEVGVLGKGVKVWEPASFMEVEEKGEKLLLWRDLDKVGEEMLRLSIEDKENIEEFIRLVRTYSDTAIVAKKPFEAHSLWEKVKLIYSMRHIGKVHKKYAKMSIAEYAERFRHPLIRKFLVSYFPVHYNVSSLFFVFGIFTNGNADLPKGGSRGMVERMVAKYQSVGGKIETGWEGKKIEIKDGKATAVVFKNGERIEADYVICACDLHHTMTQLLESKYMDKYMRERLVDHREKYPTYSSVNLYFAVDHKVTTLPEGRILDLRTTENGVEKQVVINGKKMEYGFVKHFNYEPDFAPEGHSVLQVIITQYADDYRYWSELRSRDFSKYKKTKAELGEVVAQVLSSTYAELENSLSLLDVATPVTNNRFCNTYEGAYMSFALTPYNEKVNHDGRIKGISNLYLAGQWLQAPGGLPNAVVTGRFAIERLLHDHRLKI